MISIGGHILLYVYLLFVGLLVLFSLSHLYHAIRYGRRDPLMITTTGVFVAGVVIIIVVSLSLLSQVNWSTTYDMSLPALHTNLPDVNGFHL